MLELAKISKIFILKNINGRHEQRSGQHTSPQKHIFIFELVVRKKLKFAKKGMKNCENFTFSGMAKSESENLVSLSGIGTLRLRKGEM